MTRKFGILLVVVSALAIMASSTFAVAAKFFSTSSSVDNTGALTPARSKERSG